VAASSTKHPPLRRSLSLPTAMTTDSSSALSSEQLTSDVSSRLQEIHQRITSTGRNLDDVRIVAVTKFFGADVVSAAVACGLSHIGENYLDELETKRLELPLAEATWHYLGALQSNKIRRIVAAADIVSGVSRTKELDKIASCADSCLVDIQVDYTNAEGRNGADPDMVAELLAHAYRVGVKVRGLMTVAPVDPALAAQAFGHLRSLADRYSLPECSMGMTGDLEAACLAGSTELRIGTALFGSRTTTK
jgi:uncharacterized pyridoxal phosphate-containing UPF0001 family protein